MNNLLIKLGLKKIEPTLFDDVARSAEELERRILENEMILIEKRFAVDCDKAKRTHIVSWLQQRK